MPRRMHTDIPADQLSDVSIGDTVEIVTRGKVCELRAPYEFDSMPCGCPGAKKTGKVEKKNKAEPGSISVDVISSKVREVKGKNSVPPDDEE